MVMKPLSSGGLAPGDLAGEAVVLGELDDQRRVGESGGDGVALLEELLPVTVGLEGPLKAAVLGEQARLFVGRVEGEGGAAALGGGWAGSCLRGRSRGTR
ncbi:hypothetical protein HR12_20795 [Microbacterium sp. SUBG005]|nr:hypothetical protein HR12_20795 [Microbacterium sp. SUBG005]